MEWYFLASNQQTFCRTSPLTDQEVNQTNSWKFNCFGWFYSKYCKYWKIGKLYFQKTKDSSVAAKSPKHTFAGLLWISSSCVWYQSYVLHLTWNTTGRRASDPHQSINTPHTGGVSLFWCVQSVQQQETYLSGQENVECGSTANSFRWYH